MGQISYVLKGNAKPPFLKSVNHDREVPINSSFTVVLSADWPTPSWSHETTKIEINEKEHLVIINYLGTRRPGVAMQALKSFTASVNLKLTERANWKLIVKGRTEDWESSIVVI